MFEKRLLTIIAEKLIPPDGGPCPADPSCPYSGPGWCTAPAKERVAMQQKALEAAADEYLMAYIDTDSPTVWPCNDIRIGLGVTIEEALRELEGA